MSELIIESKKKTILHIVKPVELADLKIRLKNLLVLYPCSYILISFEFGHGEKQSYLITGERTLDIILGNFYGACFYRAYYNGYDVTYQYEVYSA